jgi:hypothetical protein
MSRGKRNAGGLKSGDAVANSAPVLSQPTSPDTAGRKPEASPCSAKSWRGLGQSPKDVDEREAPPPSFLTDADVRQVIAVFELLDTWERKSHDSQIM